MKFKIDIQKFMISNTLKIISLPQKTITKDDVFLLFKGESIQRIHLKDNFAYVEFVDMINLQSLKEKFEHSQIQAFYQAKIESVGEDFKWEELGSSDSSVQSLKGDSEGKNSGESPIHLTKPSNLIVIKNCDEECLKFRTIEQIKKEFFGEFQTINRVIKEKNAICLQFEDSSEVEVFMNKYESSFPDFGCETTIHLNEPEINVTNFAEDWIKQESSKCENSGEKKEQFEEQVLKQKHEEKNEITENFQISNHEKIYEEKNNEILEIEVNQQYKVAEKSLEIPYCPFILNQNKENDESQKNREMEENIRMMEEKKMQEEEQYGRILLEEFQRQRIQEERQKMEQQQLEKKLLQEQMERETQKISQKILQEQLKKQSTRVQRSSIEQDYAKDDKNKEEVNVNEKKFAEKQKPSIKKQIGMNQALNIFWMSLVVLWGLYVAFLM